MFKKKVKREYPHALLDSPKAQTGYAEAYRTLRTNLHFSSTDKKIQVLMVASAGQSEGKTVTAFNLGHTISQTGKTTLLIDADLRKPMLSKLFKLFHGSGKIGLTSLLSDVFSTDIRNGALGEFSIMDLFQLIRLQTRTGVLRVTDDIDSVEVHFLKGKAIDITWLTRGDEKKLVNALIQNGAITAENAKTALQHQQETGLKSGIMLVNLGFLKEDQLKGPLNIHLMESFQVLTQMKTGAFQFDDRPESHFTSSKSNTANRTEPIVDQLLNSNAALPFLENKIEEAVLATKTEGLFVLPSGFIPPNPSELLGSERLTFLLGMLKTKYDFIIIDTPPIIAASDALLLAPQSDGVALVVRSGLYKRHLIIKALEQLHRTQANLLGIILNSVDFKKNGYYSYYKYASYYGDTESDQTPSS